MEKFVGTIKGAGYLLIPLLYLMLPALLLVYILYGDSSSKSYDYDPDCSPDYMTGCN